MASWPNRPGARGYGRRRGNTRPLIAVVLLLGLIGFHAYQSWISKPPSPLIGRARVLDGDSIEIAGARIRLQGIDAPEFGPNLRRCRGADMAVRKGGCTGAQTPHRHPRRDVRAERLRPLQPHPRNLLRSRRFRCQRLGRAAGLGAGVWRCQELPLGAGRSASRQARHLGGSLLAARGMETTPPAISAMRRARRRRALRWRDKGTPRCGPGGSASSP